jgi:hypothetical protein|tara:strand:- start:78 stop:779 length:702 start_codon:yes stop_codon:yes gene_type:complete
MNILESITKNPLINPRGCKLVELPMLSHFLGEEEADLLIIGERGSEDGVLATALAHDNISKPVHCIDIQNMDDDLVLYGKQKVREGEMKFFHEDLFKWEPPKLYDYVACINVLEHFGFEDGGKCLIKDYDFDGLRKMLSICNKKAIFTIPYDPFLIGEYEVNGGQRYSPSRVATLNTIARNAGFYCSDTHTLINLFCSNKFKIAEEKDLPLIRETKGQHEYLIHLTFKRILEN